MRTWNLHQGDALQLTIASDPRLADPDYPNDHIWDLDLSGGDPSALSIRSTYGLRARMMRIFPRFSENNKSINDPDQFPKPVTVKSFYPNFISVTFSPINDIDVSAYYWAAGSQVIAGQFSISNQSHRQHTLRFELIGQLIPLEGQPMSSSLRQSVATLEGQAAELFPVLFLTGGPVPGPGPYTSLSMGIDMTPGSSRQFSWALASLKSPQESFDFARKTASRPIEAEKALIENINFSDTVEIHTGDQDWDSAFALSQKNALSLFMPGRGTFPEPGFVLSRQPDHGFSHQGDGSDYQQLWNGQSILEAQYLISLLPGASYLSRGILNNYLHIQDKHNGFIDCRPGLAGQKGRFLAAPLLSGIAWKISQEGKDMGLINKVYPSLLQFFWSWFSPAIDSDKNGIPEWKSSLQTGLEDNPLFEGWHDWADGVNIQTVTSPGLLSELYDEAQCLIKMAELNGRSSDILTLTSQADKLRKMVLSCWNKDDLAYHYLDRDTHLCLPGNLLREQKADSMITLGINFSSPVRIQVRLTGQDISLKRPKITIHGKLNDKEITEVLESRNFSFSTRGASLTTDRIFTHIQDVEIEGINPDSDLLIKTIDLTALDISLLLPLWAGIPDEEDAQALVYRTIMDASQFDHPFGIPALSRITEPQAEMIGSSVHLPWNQLIGEGLLRYGYRMEAVRLSVHLMAAVIQNLKQAHAFYRSYNAETGAGQGDKNALQGFAPVGFFLETLGVKIESPNRVILSGENLYPWPVTVKYKGLTVTRLMGRSEIVFPNGQTVSLNDPTNSVISCE